MLLEPTVAYDYVIGATAKASMTKHQYVAMLVAAADELWPITLRELAKKIAGMYNPQIMIEPTDFRHSKAALPLAADIEASFVRQAADLRTAIDSNDLPTILRLVKGKSLYDKLKVGLAQKPFSVAIGAPEQRYRDIRRVAGFTDTMRTVYADFRAKLLAKLT